MPVIRLLSVRRATQNVVAAPPGGDEARVLLVLASAVDAPGQSVLGRIERRLHRGRRRRWTALLPGALGLHLIALAAVAAFAGARVAGAGGGALGAGQLVPTVVLILLVGAFLDAAFARPAATAPADGPATALAVAAALDDRPPRHMAVEVLIGGAGEAGAPGMRAYVRARRRTLAAEDVVVLQLGSAPGPPRVVVRDGEIVGVRLHPRLVELAAEAAGPDALVAGRSRSAARVARGARWPALALEGDAEELTDLVLRLVAGIDAEVGARAVAGSTQ